MEEGGEGRPCVEHVIHLLADLVFRGEQASLFTHPITQFLDERGGQDLAHGKPFGGGAAVDVALDVEDAVNALHSLKRERRYDDAFAGLALQLSGDIGELEQISPGVRPAGGVNDHPLGSGRVVERIIARVIVSLQDAVEAGQMFPAVLALPVPGIIEQCH